VLGFPKTTRLLTALIALFLREILSAELAAPRPEPVVRSEKSLVLIPVSATDTNGRFVAGLRLEDFELRDSGKAQQISSFAVEDGPISLCLVFDASMSMRTALPHARDAVRKLIAHSSIGDEFILISVRTEPSVLIQRTTDPRPIQNLVEQLQPEGDTALFDALMLAMLELRDARHRRRAIAVLSDGADNASRYTGRELLRALREADVAVYAIHLTDWSAESWDTQQALTDFAHNSGGRYFRAKTAADFARIAASLDVRQHYVLGYTPSHTRWDGKYRPVDLRVTSVALRKSIHVAWRRGYYTPAR
jgi:VWFA-related protein